MVFNTGDIIYKHDEIPSVCNIVKYGAATEHTIGQLNLSNVSAKGYRFTSRGYSKQIEILSTATPFAGKGDSGALVFTVTGDKDNYTIKALGLLVGGTDHGSTMVTPIWAVLGFLKKHIQSPLSLYCFDINTQFHHQDKDKARDNTRLRGVEKQLFSHGERFEKIESQIDEMKDNIQAILAEHDKRSQKIESQIFELNDNFQASRAEQKEQQVHFYQMIESKFDQMMNKSANLNPENKLELENGRPTPSDENNH